MNQQINRKIKTPKLVIYMLFIGFIIRIIIAIWNGFFGPSFGAELDAVVFHKIAVEYSQNLTLGEFRIGYIYSFFLGAFYAITTDSLFLGSLLSCITWLLSAIVLLKIIKLISINRKNQLRLIFIYSFLPSSLLYTSVTLREPYQLLFVNIIFYSALLIITTKSIRHWIKLFFGIISAGALHGALMAYGIITTMLILFFSSISKRKKLSLGKILLATPFILLVFSYGLEIIGERAFQLGDGVSSAIEKQQEGGLSINARAKYKQSSGITGPLDLLIYIPISLFQYLFEPMPWRISSIIDIPIVLENILRFWLIWRAFKSLRQAPSHLYYPMIFCILSYFSIETIWSIGTLNWGTASRHHIPSLGILLIIAFFSKKSSTT